MDSKVLIKIYRQENLEQFTADFAEDDSKLETGSLAAGTAAYACSLLERAAKAALSEYSGNERAEYISRNAGIAKNYMVHLVDEDVKCKAPLRKAMKEGGQREIEACRQPASAICNEIINVMGTVLDFSLELLPFCPDKDRHYVDECAHLAVGALRACMSYVVDMSGYMTDDTMKYVVKRENEITLEKCLNKYSEILAYER